MKSISAYVRGLVAYQVGGSPSAITGGHRLWQDLRLTPLGRVMVALEMEELTGLRVSTDALGAAETIDHLVGLFERAFRSERYDAERWRARTAARLAG